MDRFSISCISHSSVEVVRNQPKKSHRETNSSPPSSGEVEQKLNSSLGLPAHLPKPNISDKLQKLVKGFKSLPHKFQTYNREEEEEMEMEMEIGLPTDVQHVGHIGWDASNSIVSAIKNWDRAPTEFMSFPSLSLETV